jgi:peptidyl-prolyl cis-trans isomerase B (cyclophilin B)
LATSIAIFAGKPNPGGKEKTYAAPPKMAIDVAKTYTATIETNRGKIILDLFPKDAPKTVNNFVFLAREGVYDGLKFHRVIADFMIQGGDPRGDGSGDAGYKFEDETTNNPRKFQVGSLAMANAGPNTNGSQFFITHIATDWLQGKHTIFGQVHDKASQDVVNAIKQGDTITTITIDEK